MQIYLGEKQKNKGIIVDIGTGDGKFAYKLAKENPDRLIIGIDPNQKNLERLSLKTYKKSARGGLKNCLFVLASIEDMPKELKGVANQVFINFPWGSLLRGIILIEQETWKNIKYICQKGAIIDLLLGYDKNIDRTEIKRLKLPILTQDYIKNNMAPKLAKQGFKITDLKLVNSSVLKNFPSSWAKKLSYGKDRMYYYLRIISK